MDFLHGYSPYTDKGQVGEGNTFWLFVFFLDRLFLQTFSVQSSVQGLYSTIKWCAMQIYTHTYHNTAGLWQLITGRFFCTVAAPICALRAAAVNHNNLPLARPACNWECWVVQSVQPQTGLLRRRLEQGKTALKGDIRGQSHTDIKSTGFMYIRLTSTPPPLRTF